MQRGADPRQDARRVLGTVAILLVIGVAAAALFLQIAGNALRHTNHDVTPHVTTTARVAARQNAPPTTISLPPISYQVRPGDTLTTIAAQFAATVPEVVALNHLGDADRLTEGETLLVPQRPPISLSVSPQEGHAGDPFRLRLAGARPSETVSFTIQTAGGAFVGPLHTAGADGTVDATYRSVWTDGGSTATVVARGNQGTVARTTFVIDAPAAGPFTTTAPGG